MVDTLLWDKVLNVVLPWGDWGGYRIYEWFKLFPNEREIALREYVYLKAHCVRDVLAAQGKKISLEEWNQFYQALGHAMENDPTFSNHGTYAGLLDALNAYAEPGANIQAIFAQRSTLNQSVYSRQFVKDLTNLISRMRADLRKSLQ